MSEFAAVIDFTLNGEQQNIVLDTIDDVSINGAATITSQPMLNGDSISDHMFRQGKSLTLSGICSLNGSKVLVLTGDGNRLQNFEKVFEQIQNEGILCSIYKTSLSATRELRFLKRESMVLESFNWTEGINDVSFRLNFKQILFTNVVEYNPAKDDAFLPNVNVPSQLSFTETLLDFDKVTANICKTLEDEKLWTNEFKQYINSIGGDEILRGFISIAAFGVIASVLAALNTTPVGWVLTAAGLAIAGVYFIVKGIVDIIENQKRLQKYRIQVFTYSPNNDKRNAQEVERFADFIQGIKDELSKLDNSLHVYQISEDVSQFVELSIGDDYYEFEFTKGEVITTLKVSNIDKTIIRNDFQMSAALESFDQATGANYVIKAKNNARVYLVNPNEDKKKLTNYYIVVCDFNPDDYNKIISDIVSSHIFKKATT